MGVRWECTGCDLEQQRVLENACEEVWPALEDRLEEFALEARELTFVVQHDAHRTMPWRIYGMLTVERIGMLSLQIDHILVRVEAPNPVFAVDDCVGKIIDRLVEMMNDDPDCRVAGRGSLQQLTA